MSADLTDRGLPEIGDYVLGTKYSDGDPGDNWALGFYAGPMLEYTPPRYDVKDSDGRSIRGNGFRRVARIRRDVGRWLLTGAAKQLEASPPGTVNLWTMLTPLAFDLYEDHEAVPPTASPVVHPAGERTASSEGPREAHAGYRARPNEQDGAPPPVQQGVVEALEKIASMPGATDEWDAVEKYKACRELALASLRPPAAVEKP